MSPAETETPPRPDPAPEPDPEAQRAADDKAFGELVFEVTEKTAILVREEVELAKAEIAEKLRQLMAGSVAGLVAGAFGFLALILFMHGFAWLLDDIFFDNKFWPGFFIEGLLFTLVAVGGGLYAWRSLKAGSPPTPEKAIEEAKAIRSTFESKGEGE